MMTLGRNILVLCLCRSYCGQEYTQGRAQELGEECFPQQPELVRTSRRIL